MIGSSMSMFAAVGTLLHLFGGIGSLEPPQERRWRAVGASLEPVPSEVRTDVVAGTHGIRLSGDRTPFVVSRRMENGLEAFPRDHVTLEGWISIDRPSAWGGIIGAIQDNGTAETGIVLGYREDRPFFAVSSEGVEDVDGRMTYLVGRTPLVIGKWHHLVGTYDGVSMKLFLDGEFVAESREQSGPVRFSGDEPFVIGGYFDQDEDFGLDGRLREVSVLSEALDAEKIRRRFERQRELASLPPEVDTTLEWDVPPFLCWPAVDAMSIVVEVSVPSAVSVVVREEDGEVAATVSRQTPATLHDVRVDGLSPNTKYFYQVVAEGFGQRIESDLKTFRTSAGRGDPFTFVAIGDTQSQPAVVKRIADLAYETRPNLLVHAGDLVSTGGNRRHWTDHFFPNMRPLIERVPIMPVLGNHEQDASLYYEYMSLPEPERWYAFSYGDADFFMIDGNRSLGDQSEQIDWLESALAASDAEWKFAVLHQPPWTSDSDDYGDTFVGGSRRGDPNARNITSLLEEHGVDICFSGHVHDYERTFPLIGDEVVPWDEGGVIYVTTAGGGGSLENFDPANTVFGHRKARRHHLVYCGIHDGILEFQAMDEQGRLFDVLTLDKRDGRRAVARAARRGVEISPRSPTWRDSPVD